MRSRHHLMVFAALAFLAIPAMAQAYSWQTWGGSQYALTDSFNTWSGAEAEAVAAGGHLVSINSEAENDFIIESFFDVFTELGSIPGDDYQNPWLAIAWIGLVDTTYGSGTSTWQWASGDTYNYNDPLDLAGADEIGPHAYIHLNPHPSAGTWNANIDHDLYSSMYPLGIIEVRTAATPEPSTLVLAGFGLIGAFAVSRRLRTQR